MQPPLRFAYLQYLIFPLFNLYLAARMRRDNLADKPQSFRYLNLPKQGYLFVITYGRSGSTLTQNLLNSIPGYCIRGENAHVTSFLCRAILAIERDENIKRRRALARRPNGTDRVLLRKMMGKPFDPWYGAESINVPQFGKGLFNSFVRSCLNLPDGTRVGGFKEIRLPYAPDLFDSHLDILRVYFPSTRFIFQTRDYATISKSAWWASRDPEETKSFLKMADSLFLNYLNRHPDICFHLRYETYSEDPTALKPLFKFLDEPFDAERIASILAQKLTHAKPRARERIGDP
jgi:hypothetical protein